MKKKFLISFLLFSLVLFIFVSCSSTKNTDSKKADTKSSSVVEEKVEVEDGTSETDDFMLGLNDTDSVYVIQTEITDLSETFSTKYGNLSTNLPVREFILEDIAWGDIIEVSFLDKSLKIPVVPTYSYVDTGATAVIMNKGEDGRPTGNISLAINMGDFITTYGLGTKTTNEDKTWFWTENEDVVFPVTISFKMSKKGGYATEFLNRDLTRTNNREDYAMLTDEQFANFRRITTNGMNNLYRTSNPVNSELGRNVYADRALSRAHVNVVLNLADDEETAKSRPEFADTYYSKIENVKYLNLGVDFTSEDFKKGLADGLKYMASREGKFAIHCTEGKDRAGFVAALLECLKGATLDQVVEDYMETYYNYYGVEKGTDKYNSIAESNIIKTLQQAFKVSSLEKADLTREAEEYLKEIGLSDMEIALLYIKL